MTSESIILNLLVESVRESLQTIMTDGLNGPKKMDDLRKYYLELASRVCEGITPDHYDRWLKWAKENG
ncbi:hypothetical protein [Lactococcus lactis]|nr:hypothetical protein [Lactococcus lactis]ABD63862.1 unknown [Lactococcus phage phismq86]ARE02259.1 prophage protein [Lactococcus lactis subsp. lactis]ARE04615.1 prophage protein [Lactococcus lactis subsp. lactis]